MPSKRRSIAEQREQLRAQLATLKKRDAALAARETKAARKKDTRRKIILGGALLAHAAQNPKFDQYVRTELKPFLAKAKESDKAMIPDWL